MKKAIYADNAATTSLDIKAYEAMQPFFLEKYGNPSQPYSFSREPKKALLQARRIIAECINADEDEIFFTSGGTESDNWALRGIYHKNRIIRIITDRIEHHAILETCSSLQKEGNKITYLKTDRNGYISNDSLEKKINNKTDIVSIMMVNNEIGTIQNIKKMCEVTHKRGALFHTDAVQALGHIEVDVKDLNIDLLSASAHKFNGPKGIGFLYIKKGTKISPLIFGGKQQNSFRAGTENVALIIGMAVALKNNCKTIEINSVKLKAIEAAFLKVLEDNKVDFIINGLGDKLPGLINISIFRANGEQLLHRMDLEGCYISTGSACDSVNNQISHVIKEIKVPKQYAEGTIRVSFGKNNTLEEAKELAERLVGILKAD